MNKYQRDSLRKHRSLQNELNRRTRIEERNKRLTALAIREPDIIHVQPIVIAAPEPNPQLIMVRLMQKIFQRVGF